MKNKVRLLAVTSAMILAFTCCGMEEITGDVAGNQTDSEAIETGEETAEGVVESEEIESEPEDPEPTITTVTISATGDCALGKLQTHGYDGSFLSYYDTYGEEYFLAGVRDIFEEDDFTLVDLECVLSNSENRVEQEYSIKGYPEYSGILSSSSVEGAVLWNNHTSDYGPESLVDTENALTDVGIDYAYGDKLGYYTTEDGIRIGFISVMMINESQDRLNIMLDGIRRLQEEGVDLILACCHWGIEREYYPTEFQQSAAHTIIDAGADAVIGCHPHVLQGMEYYNGKIICYSLGNFCFGANRNPADKDSVIYQQTFTFVDGVKQEDLNAKIIPVKISSQDNLNDFQPTVQTGGEAATIIENMNTYSEPYSSLRFDADGNMTTN